MKIYISGPITNNPDAQEDFERGEKLALKIMEPVQIPATESIVNPMKRSAFIGKSNPDAGWEDYMRFDIPLLCKCDTILMLKGWRRSKGAKLEIRIAKELGLKVIYEEKLSKRRVSRK